MIIKDKKLVSLPKFLKEKKFVYLIKIEIKYSLTIIFKNFQVINKGIDERFYNIKFNCLAILLNI